MGKVKSGIKDFGEAFVAHNVPALKKKGRRKKRKKRKLKIKIVAKKKTYRRARRGSAFERASSVII